MIEEFKEASIRKYLSEKLNGKVTHVRIEKLGSGVVGTGYSVSFKLNGKPQKKILKTLFTENLGLDHYSDRARSLILANENYNTMDKHVKSIDVIGISKKEFISIGDAEEFFILMEEAKGEDFFKDLENLKEELNGETKDKIVKLAEFLVKLHGNKKDSYSLYKRKIRDTVGSECLMGVFDVYPEEVNWTSEKEIGEIVKRSVDYWIKTRNMKHRLCEIHGDYHPGNLWFEEDGEFTLLDRARGTWGEAADDLTAFLINPIFYSLAKNGRFDGAYKEIFDLFWNTYFKKTGDKEMRTVMAPYFAFRVAVVCTPAFYGDEFFGDAGNARIVRRKLFNFALNVLKDSEFKPEKIKEYLG
jgi:aminoglycoside phosphotransferase (APT) family kinase protein